MICELNILAAGDGNWGGMIALAVFAIISVVGSIAKKAAEKRQQQQAEAEYNRRRQEREAQEAAARAAAQRQEQPVPAQWAVPPPLMRRAERPTPCRPAAQVEPPPVRPQAPPTWAGSPQPIRKAAPKPPPRPETFEMEEHSVDTFDTIETETSRLREREEELDKKRQSKLSGPGVRVEGKVGTFKPVAAVAFSAEGGVQVEPLDGDHARTAMVYYEIFSPPLALRDQPAAWET